MPASDSLADGRQDGGASLPDGDGGAPTPGGGDGAPSSGGGAAQSGGQGRRSLASLAGALAADPAAAPALAALALIVAWAANQAGYPQTHWAPGGVILLALLAIAIGAGGARLASTPRAVRTAIAAFAAYTALSFLSILWAAVPADAWEGADRTLLYLIVFALFAAPRRAGNIAALLLCLWALAMAGLAVFTVLHVNAAAGQAASLQRIMPGGRLIFPAGYTNATAALWMIAFFPAWILASARWPGWVGAPMRGLLAGGAVVLAATALYSQSRGSVFSTPVVIALVFLLLPGRVRSFATLLPIAAGVAACAPAVLSLAERAESGSPASPKAHAAAISVLIAAAAVAALVAIAAAIERRSRISSRAEARLHRGLAIAGVLTALGLIAGGLIAVGDPVARAKHEWNTFASQHGYAANETGKSRLISGLGSSRADFYRVAWHELASHPLLGIGADNFAVPYLRLRHTDETPHYPHSVELRTLAETGALGAAIALIGLLAALLAGGSALRAQDRLARTVAAAALAGFGYWAIHGSFDWFFEYAGLGAAAFALLGLGCSLAPAVDTSTSRGGRVPPGLRIAGGVSALALALLAAASLVAPWLSRMEVQSAARAWTLSPAVAYDRLAEAARLNPLSDEPDLVAGTIALRLGELRRAEHQFERALDRNPEGEYATLELGAIASDLGDRGRALALLRRATLLDPRDRLARQALLTVRSGGHVNVVYLNRSIFLEARRLL